MNTFRKMLTFLGLALAANAQTVTGSIRGTVADSGDAVLGATVGLTNQITRQALEFLTDSSGAFVFPNLVPGDYDLRITQPGFKTFVQNGINIAANERVDVHTLMLSVGDISNSIEIKGEVVHVATDSSDRGVLINTTQVENTTTVGRSYLDLMRSLSPAVPDGVV
jgi:Carboxypeptidase regulatory-like domain